MSHTMNNVYVAHIHRGNEYKSSILFFVFHFIFHKLQFVIYLFNFLYKISKVKKRNLQIIMGET